MVVKNDPYNCDNVVVGAGFVGLCCAIHILRRQPNSTVTILDADVAGGATALRCSAMFMRFGFSAVSRQMTQESDRFYDTLTDFDSDVWEKHPFYWMLNHSQIALQKKCLLGSVRKTSAHDIERIATQIPRLNLHVNEELIFDATVHRARPERLHSALLSAMLATGRARLIEGCHVSGVRDLGSNGVGVLTPFGEFISREVAVCIAGAVKEQAFARFFQSRSIRAKKIVSFYIPFAETPPDPLGIAFLSDETYLMPDPQKGRWVLSITSHDWDVDVRRSALTFNKAELNLAQEFVSDRLGMDGNRIMGAAVYGDAYSPELVPAVLRPSEFGGKLAIATGTAGYGLKVAPALARSVLEAEHELSC